MKRTIKPYHIVCQKGSWYVIGFDDYKNDIRIFAFSRIKNAAFTGEIFEIPKDFDWQKYIDADIGVWASSQVSHKIRLRFAAEIATFASEHIWSRSQIVTQNDDGTVDVAFETTQLPEVQRWVLGQGHTVQVLEPQELIDAVKAELLLMVKIYGNL